MGKRQIATEAEVYKGAGRACPDRSEGIPAPQRARRPCYSLQLWPLEGEHFSGVLSSEFDAEPGSGVGKHGIAAAGQIQLISDLHSFRQREIPGRPADPDLVVAGHKLPSALIGVEYRQVVRI